MPCQRLTNSAGHPLAWRDANVESHSQPANRADRAAQQPTGQMPEGTGRRVTGQHGSFGTQFASATISTSAPLRRRGHRPLEMQFRQIPFGPCLTECRTERGVGGSARCSRRHNEATSQRRPGDPGASDLDTEGLNWSTHCAKAMSRLHTDMRCTPRPFGWGRSVLAPSHPPPDIAPDHIREHDHDQRHR
jgi:hypothetical protein